MSKKTLWAMALAVIFTGAVMANQAQARNCGVTRANIIDDNPTGTMGGQISQTSIRAGHSTNQAVVAGRGISDQASPNGFDTNNLFLLKVTITAGGHSFWHYHPGVNYIMVKQGTVSYYTVNRDGSCNEHVVSPTDGFVEVPGMIHALENKSGTDLVIYASVLMAEDLAHFTVDTDCSDNFCDPGLTEPTGANCPAGFGTSNGNGDAC